MLLINEDRFAIARNMNFGVVGVDKNSKRWRKGDYYLFFMLEENAVVNAAKWVFEEKSITNRVYFFPVHSWNDEIRCVNTDEEELEDDDDVHDGMNGILYILYIKEWIYWILPDYLNY